MNEEMGFRCKVAYTAGSGQGPTFNYKKLGKNSNDLILEIHGPFVRGLTAFVFLVIPDQPIELPTNEPTTPPTNPVITEEPKEPTTPSTTEEPKEPTAPPTSPVSTEEPTEKESVGEKVLPYSE